MKRFLLSLIVAVASCLPGTLMAMAEHTQVTLHLSAATVKPGDTITASVRLKMDKGWHTYWVYGGDAGIPTAIKWNLPKGITAGAIQWPTPEKGSIPEAELYTYEYHDEVMLLVPLQIAADAPKGKLDIKANVAWQECEVGCLEGEMDVATQLEIAAETKSSPDAATIEAWRKKLPAAKADELKPRAAWAGPATGQKRKLIIEWTLPEAPAKADFFPYEPNKFEVGGETLNVSLTSGKIHLEKEIKLPKSAKDWPKKISGLLVASDKDGKSSRSWEVSLTPEVSAAKSDAAPMGTDGTAPTSLIVWMAFAIIGGLILNIMPCVLPVIALKVLGFVSQAKESPGRVRQLGLIYGLGVMVSFIALAGIAIGVQKAGGLAGWSDLFQNPQFRVLITILMTLIALNLFGVFEITLGGGTMDAASSLTTKSGPAGAFFNGVLATVLATPCTAPFLAGALGFAFAQPPLIIVLIMCCVGLGLALPFVLLCWHPAWLKLLPKPGAWMERFKVAMGFPMLATAVWLFWVTATRMGSTGVLWFGLFLVLLAAAAWIWGEFIQRGTRRKGLAIAAMLCIVGLAYGGLLEGVLKWRAPADSRKAGIEWKPWSHEAVQAARAAGHPVLVDFTADSCLTCKANLITAIDVASVRAKLKEIGAVTLEGDYTDRNPEIAQELRKYQRGGVPLVLIYSGKPDEPPQVMPTLLSAGIVIEALNKAAGTAPAGPQVTVKE